VTSARRHVAIAGLVLAAGLGGCVQYPRTHVSMDELVAEYNANAAMVPRLKARAKIHVTITDEQGRRLSWGSTSPLASPNGLLLLSKTDDPPGGTDFVLVGRESLAVELFRVGSSASEGKYYLWYQLGGTGRAWWGRLELAGAPGIGEIAIDPNQLLSVLAVCPLPQDFTELPTVLMRMSKNPCAYVLTCVDRQARTGRIIATREIYFNWDDSGLRRPFMIKLLSPEGEHVMTAKLDKYRQIDTDPPETPAPLMPTDIRIDWPAKGNKVHLVLSDLTTADTWDVSYCRFAEELPSAIGPADIVQVDEALETGVQSE